MGIYKTIGVSWIPAIKLDKFRCIEIMRSFIYMLFI